MTVPSARRTFLSHARLAIGRRALVWMVLGVLAALVLSAVELAIALFIQLFLAGIGVLAPGQESVSLLRGVTLSPASLAVFLLTVSVVRAFCQYAIGYSANVAMEMITARLRRFAIFEMLLHPEDRYVSASTMNVRISEYFVKASLFAYAIATLLSLAVQAGGLLLVMLAGAARESMIALVGLFFVGNVIRALNRRSARVAEKVPQELETVTKGIERIARNATLVRALRTQEREHGKFVRSIDAYAEHSIASGHLGSVAMAITPLAGSVLIVVIVVVSQTWFKTPSLTLLSFLYLFMRFVQALGGAVTQWSVCAQRLPQFRESVNYVGQFSAADVEVAMREPVLERLAAARPVVDRAATRRPPPALALENVTFRYPGTERLILDDVTMRVEPGRQIAVVGPSGSGKSTLLGLMLGLLRPQSGRVVLDGRAPQAFFKDPAVRIGYVGAEAFLIAGTLRDNLMYGAQEERTDAELWAALSQARLESTVKALPGGLDYGLTEEGAGLSAGQKQRLCLARAFLSEPHVLILDEASANLDEATENEIAESLSALRGTCTTIVVSHRPGIMKYADQTLRVGELAAEAAVFP